MEICSLMALCIYQAICSLMDGIPTFCIVDERKQFVPLRVQGATGAVYILTKDDAHLV